VLEDAASLGRVEREDVGRRRLRLARNHRQAAKDRRRKPA
jgi:hypothetical protein